jgi:hypothetical protein
MVSVDGRLGWSFAFVNPQLSAVDADISVTCPPGWSMPANRQRLGAVAAGARASATFLVAGCPEHSDGDTFTFTIAIDGKTQDLTVKCLPYDSPAQLRGLLARQDGATALRVAPDAITIDGDLGEWTGDGMVSIATRASVCEESESGAWQGPYDSAASLRLRWDGISLYVGARVFDDHPVFARDAKTAYEWDCLELFLSQDGTALAQGLLFPFPPDATGPRAWWFNTQSDLGCRVACKPAPHGYVIEAAIPCAGLGLSPRPGASIPFTFSLDDADVPGHKRTSVLVWKGDTSNYKSAKQWGVLTFK